jgi:AcrR family transcriptional regulator
MTMDRRKQGSLRPPRQDRSRVRLDRIIKVTEDLLKDRRFDQITITDIVKGAETSVGVFYSRFSNKQALLEFLEEKVYEEAQEMLAKEMAKDVPTSPRDAVQRVVDLALKLHRKYSGISREIVHNAWGDPAHLKRGVQWNEGVAAVIRPIFAGIANPKLHADVNHAADFAIMMVLGSIREMIPGNFWPRSMRQTNKDLSENITQTVLLFLTGTA